MKNNKDEGRGHEKHAQAILQKIQEESAREAREVIGRAQAESDRIISDAEGESARLRIELFTSLKHELDKARERVFSGVNLEKKRLVLEEKDRFIRQVLDAVRAMGEGFRQKPGYDDFLRRAVAEGSRVIGGTEMEIVYAAPDEKLFRSGGFILPLESLCQSLLKSTVTFRYTKGDFTEIGVIVCSADGRIQYDNRFSSRLARMERDIYVRLLRESF